MYCKKCGRFDTDKAEKCKYCGSTDVTRELPRRAHTDYHTLGVFLSLFLGPIGLIIGLTLYPDGNEKAKERKTFIDGWIVGYLSLVILAIIFGVPIALIF